MEQMLLLLPPLIVAGGIAALIVRPAAVTRPSQSDDPARPAALVAAENGELKGRIGRLEERLATLERAGDADRRAARHPILR